MKQKGADFYVKPKNGTWEKGVRIIKRADQYSGYAGFSTGLTVDRNGMLHAICNVYEGKSGKHQALCYMRSRDDGKSWETAKGKPVSVPARPEQMDLWFLYDGFLHFVPMWMENLGLVPRGEAGNYLEGGDNIRLSTGEHPLNTHGGQLSEGRLHGQGHVLEAVQQLRGTAGPRQTKTKANYAIISSVFPATGAAGILSLE